MFFANIFSYSQRKRLCALGVREDAPEPRRARRCAGAAARPAWHRAAARIASPTPRAASTTRSTDPRPLHAQPGASVRRTARELAHTLDHARALARRQRPAPGRDCAVVRSGPRGRRGWCRVRSRSAMSATFVRILLIGSALLLIVAWWQRDALPAQERLDPALLAEPLQVPTGDGAVQDDRRRHRIHGAPALYLRSLRPRRQQARRRHMVGLYPPGLERQAQHYRPLRDLGPERAHRQLPRARLLERDSSCATCRPAPPRCGAPST